jgi:hypothetical protein
LIDFFTVKLRKQKRFHDEALNAGAKGSDAYTVKFHELIGDKAHNTVQAAVEAGTLDNLHKKYVLDLKTKNDAANAKDYGSEMSIEPEMSTEDPEELAAREKEYATADAAKAAKAAKKAKLKAMAKPGYARITAAVRKMPGLAKFAGGQKHVDALAKKLKLKAGRDFKNYRQMEAAILKALKGGATRKPAWAKKPMSGDPEPDELDYQDRRGRVRDAKPGELPPKITRGQQDRLGKE